MAIGGFLTTFSYHLFLTTLRIAQSKYVIWLN